VTELREDGAPRETTDASDDLRDDSDGPGDTSLREFLAAEDAGADAVSDDAGVGAGNEADAGAGETCSEGTADPELAAALRELDLARTTPIEALNALHDLQSRLDDGG